MTPVLLDKLACRCASLREMPCVLVAYSGGVDSALVMAVAHRELGDRSLARIGVSPSFPARLTRLLRWTAALLLLVGCGPALHGQAVQQRAVPPRAVSGTLHVAYFYLPPTSVEPTYHTAMWLEDMQGKLVKTLYVSQELSNGEYKLGQACPDWVKVARWEKVSKPEVAAVTAPTPNVGSEAKAFDLAALGVPPGTYQFKFQVHITEQYNVLHSGKVTVGPADAQIKIEVAYGPGKSSVTDRFVRDVEVHYIALAK